MCAAILRDAAQRCAAPQDEDFFRCAFLVGFLDAGYLFTTALLRTAVLPAVFFAFGRLRKAAR